MCIMFLRSKMRFAPIALSEGSAHTENSSNAVCAKWYATMIALIGAGYALVGSGKHRRGRMAVQQGTRRLHNLARQPKKVFAESPKPSG